MGIYTKLLNEQLNFEAMLNSIDYYNNLNESVNFKTILDKIINTLEKFKKWIIEKFRDFFNKYIKKEKEYNKMQKEKSSNNIKSDSNEESKDITFNEPIKYKFYNFPSYLHDEIGNSIARARGTLFYPNSTKISDIDQYIESNKKDNKDFSKILKDLENSLSDVLMLDESEKILYSKKEAAEFYKSLKKEIDLLNNSFGGENKEAIKKAEDEILKVIAKLEKDIRELKNNDINLSSDQVNNLIKNVKETIGYIRLISIDIQKLAIEIDPKIKFNTNTLLKVQSII